MSKLIRDRAFINNTNRVELNGTSKNIVNVLFNVRYLVLVCLGFMFQRRFSLQMIIRETDGRDQLHNK